MAKGRPALATLLDDARRDLARRAGIGHVRRRVPDPRRASFQRAWWWAVIGAGAIVLAAMYMLRLISAVLHEARGSTVHDEALDLRPGELALLVPLVGDPARALGVARGDLAPLVRRRPRRRSRWRRSSSDPDAARRLVRDLDDPRAARRVVRRAARRRARAATPRAARSRRASPGSASSAGSSRRSGCTSTAPTAHLVVADAFYRDRWTALAQIDPLRHRARDVARRRGARGAAARTTTSPSSSRCCSPRPPAWRSSSARRT